MAAITRPGVRVFLYVFVALVLLTMLFPFYWIVNMSLQTSNQLYDIPPHFWPPRPTLENFASVLLEERGLMRFYEAVFNTLIVAAVAMAVCVALGSITGYALARLNFKWGLWFLFVLISTQMVPPLVDLIPLYIIFRRILKLVVYWRLKLIKHIFSIKPVCSFKNFIPDAFFFIVYLTHSIAGAPAWTISEGFGAPHRANKSCSAQNALATGPAVKKSPF